MKKTVKIITVISICALAQTAFAGPFGLNMGDKIKDIDPKAKLAAPNIYITSNVPTPHSSFENYAIKVGPKSGLCWIKAIGKDVSTSSFGFELKSDFNNIKEKLSNVYGEADISDFLMPGSIWKDPNDFMMGLIKKERVLMALWNKDKGSNLKGNLTQIGLLASATSGSKGYISVEYSFSNSEECDKEISEKEDNAL